MSSRTQRGHTWRTPEALSRVAREVVDWCCVRLDLDDVKVEITLQEDDHWGQSWQGDTVGHYHISVNGQQPLRDLVATITHEMVHIQQWETGVWTGDGEDEAEDRQYILANEFLEERDSWR